MKLLSMHVDNFGGLHNYDYHFENGLNVILHDNGWGKTTMATFLKAMLYGYDTRRSKDITENERKRYLPWQGGKYGGSLDFEADGVRYRIYRTFGETPRFDTARIVNLDTNTTARIPSDKIGETLFHLDANAFQRSVFINQNGLSIDGAASSIHSRLNTLVSQANDVAAFDGAIAGLTKQIKVYEKTGARGLLGDIARQIAEKETLRIRLSNIIAEQDSARERIVQINTLLESLSKKLAEQSKKLEAVSGEEKKQEATRQMITDLSNRIDALQQQLDSIKEELGGRVPSKEEIDRIKQNGQLLGASHEKMKTLEADCEQLSDDYQRIATKYGNALPTMSQLDEIQRIYGEIQGLLHAGDADETIENVPEEFLLISEAMENMENFLPQLQNVINSSAHIQNLSRQLEMQEMEIQRETAAWESKTKRYGELKAEVDRLQAELEEQAAYAPSSVEPIIAALELFEKKKLLLAQQESEAKIAIQREEDSWSQRRSQYQELKKRVSTLQAKLEGQRCYGDSKVNDAIATLEKHKQLQQQLENMETELLSLEMSEEDKAILSSAPEGVPGSSECNEMLNRQRELLGLEAEIQGLSSRLEGEKSKQESFRASLAQLETTLDQVPASAIEKENHSGKAFIGSGIVLIILGLILAAMLLPLYGAIAMVGIILIVAGLASNNANRKRRVHAEENYHHQQEQFEENKLKHQQISDQLTEVEKNIKELETQISARTQRVSEGTDDIVVWVARWGDADTENVEKEIIRLSERSARIAQIKEKQNKCSDAEKAISTLKATLKEEKERIEHEYPAVSGMNANDASEALRSAQTKFAIDTELLQTAVQQLNSFLSERAIPEDEYAQEASPALATLQKQLQDIVDMGTQQAMQRKEIDNACPNIAGLSEQDALLRLRKGASLYQVTVGLLETATRNYSHFVEKSGCTVEEMKAAESPRKAVLEAAKASITQELSQCIQQANVVLKELELDTDAAHMVRALSEAEDILSVYMQHVEKCRDQKGRQEKKQQKIDELKQQAQTNLASMGISLGDADMMDLIASIRKDITTAEQIQEKIKSAEKNLAVVGAECKQAEEIISNFVSSHSHFSQQVDEPLMAIYEKANSYVELMAAKQQLVQQRTSVEEKVQRSAARSIDANEMALRMEVDALKEQRDALLIEYTQKSDSIRQADQALEQYPDVACEIRSLYEQKQTAQNKLAMLKRTIQLITAAKENLATRYLSKVEQLFNSYMHIWLNNDAIKGVLDIDFKVSIEENNKLHVAQGYSAGYCDMIDFCMRLALVDTLFEKEQPFLILDDPFVNLDAARLTKALELLNAMAANKQIVYFVCHPIRAIETAENAEMRAEFLQLAKQAQKAVGERKKSETKRLEAERRSPKEMYRVVESAASYAIRPANMQYTITNSIFGMNFVAGDLIGDHEFSFELFFIDASGRVLNDRQVIEIKNGQLSTERIQFNLNTRDDSGNEFELMIRENGHDDYEVAARYPFRAKLAFTGTFSFDL